MNPEQVSEYNREQWNSFNEIRKVVEGLPRSEIESLVKSIQPYLQFRQAVDNFQLRYAAPTCRRSCFETQLSACCGFESIITFFADQVITFLLSSQEEYRAIVEVLQQPNRTGKCVYLGENGCLWKVRPISCAMFLCDEVKRIIFEREDDAGFLWRELQIREKEFTWPTKPVLFDDIEKYFLRRGVESTHLYFHQSPGLIRLKAKAGL